jgi:hypothetical protein
LLARYRCSLRLSQETTFHAQSNVVVIPALVKNAKGETVPGLKADDFIIEDDSVVQPTHLDEAAESEPVSLVLVIQRGRRAGYEFLRIRGLSTVIDSAARRWPRQSGHYRVR